MSTVTKLGQPWLYDSETGNIVGIKNPDGSETLFTLSSSSGVSVAGYERKVTSVKGTKVLDFADPTFLASGASFSGSGSYLNQGRVAVQSSGTLVNNPIGWYDGSPCLEFTPNSDAGEFRIYFDGTLGAGLANSPMDFNDANGIAMDFEVEDVDTSKLNFILSMEFSTDATSLFPTNKASFVWFRNDSAAAATYRESKGRKYYRFRFDSTTADNKASPFPGYGYNATAGGTGANWQAPIKYIRMSLTKFNGKKIKFKSLYRGGYSTPCIIMGTDNAGPDTLVTDVAPLVAKHKMGFYANQYWQNLDAASEAALKRYRKLYAAGWELNGNDVVDRALGETVTDTATMRAAIEETRDRCLDEGWIEGSKVWVANNNSTSYLMIAELEAAGYVANRNGIIEGRYLFPEGGIPDPFRMPATPCDGKFLTDIKPMIDRCIEYGATMWLYFHNTWAKAKIDVDRTNNITGTSGAPIAVNAGETPAAYRSRAAGLGTAAGNATVTYLDAKIGATASLAIFFEDLKEIIDYIASKQVSGDLVTRRPTDWCRDVGLIK